MASTMLNKVSMLIDKPHQQQPPRVLGSATGTTIVGISV